MICKVCGSLITDMLVRDETCMKCLRKAARKDKWRIFWGLAKIAILLPVVLMMLPVSGVMWLFRWLFRRSKES